MACQINVTVEWPKTIPVEVQLDQPIPVTIDTTQGLPGPQGPPGPGSEVQDTGWIDVPMDPSFPGALIKVRRWGPWVAFSAQAITGATDPHGLTLCTLPVGFRPAYGSFAYGAVLDLGTTDVSGAAFTDAAGGTTWVSHATTGVAQYQWLTPDAFPET